MRSSLTKLSAVHKNAQQLSSFAGSSVLARDTAEFREQE